MDDKLTEKIYVDEESEKLIHFTFKQYRVMAFFWLIASALSLVVGVLRVINNYDYPFSNWFDVFNFKTYNYVFSAYTILGLFQLYYYFYGIKYQKRALEESNQKLFTKSFLYYKNANYLAIFGIGITIICESVFLIQEL